MLKLRPENFGGLIFNTENGVKLSIDQDGFITTKNFIEKNKRDFTNQQKSFLFDICQKLDLKAKEYYIVNHTNPGNLKHYPFPVLQAPTLVDFQITNYCNLSCPHCYAESSPAAAHVSYADIIRVLDNCQKAGVFEVALGGGEPTLHPNFSQILKACRKRDLVCNLATNGKELNKKMVQLLAKYCGAVALSLEFIGKEFKKRRGYNFKKFLNSVNLIKKTNLRLVFQITASKSNIFKIAEITKFLVNYKPYGIVFLTYKPVGRAKLFDATLNDLDSGKILAEFDKCFRIINQHQIKIGYDCCLGNLLTSLGTEVYGCSATRESVAINTNLDVLPCSFTTKQKLGNLKKEDLISIWHQAQANLFRTKLAQKITSNEKCRICQHKLTCLGGCPAFDLVKCQEYWYTPMPPPRRG